MGENKGAQRKHGLGFGKIVGISVVCLLALLFIIPLIFANVSYLASVKALQFAKVPFSSNIYFVPDRSVIGNSPTSGGTMTIVKVSTSYHVGEKIVISNSGSVTNSLYDSPFVLGTVEAIDGDNIIARLNSTDKTPVVISDGYILGKVTNQIEFAGYIYTSMLGTSGFVIYGVCPLLIALLLVIMIVRISSGDPSDDIEIITAEVITTTVPADYSLNPLAFYIKAADLAIVSPTPIEQVAAEPTPVEQVAAEPTPIEEVAAEPTPIEQVAAEPTPIEEVAAEPTPIEEVAAEPTPIEENENALPKRLSADEIIQLYRLAKKNEVAPKKKPADNSLAMAKLYYDDKIGNYTKQE